MDVNRDKVREFIADPANAGVGSRIAGRRLGIPESTFRSAVKAILKSRASGEEMSTATGLEVHEYCSIFPALTGAPLQELADDIRANGLIEPIELFEGKILDGRNRHNACLMVDVEPRTIEFTGSRLEAIAHVFSKNFHRRHLDESQRGMAGARAKPLYEEAAKDRQESSRFGSESTVSANLHSPEKWKSSQKAAEAVNVSTRTVEAASKVLKEGIPELVQAVEKGEVKVSAAAEIAKLSKEEQKEVISRGPKAVKAKAKEGRKRKSSTKSKAGSNGSIVKDHVPELTDADWLETLKVREYFGPYARSIYDADALAYRRWKEVFTDDMAKAAEKIWTASKGQRMGVFQAKLMGFVQLKHPRDWRRCGECLGAGCDGCQRRGYVIV